MTGSTDEEEEIEGVIFQLLVRSTTTPRWMNLAARDRS